MAAVNTLTFSSEKEAYPRFVVQFHNDNFILDERVKQPSDVKIFAYQIFIFKTPVQDEVERNKYLETIFQLFRTPYERSTYQGAKYFWRPTDLKTDNLRTSSWSLSSR